MVLVQWPSSEADKWPRRCQHKRAKEGGSKNGPFFCGDRRYINDVCCKTSRFKVFAPVRKVAKRRRAERRRTKAATFSHMFLPHLLLGHRCVVTTGFPYLEGFKHSGTCTTILEHKFLTSLKMICFSCKHHASCSINVLPTSTSFPQSPSPLEWDRGPSTAIFGDLLRPSSYSKKIGS